MATNMKFLYLCSKKAPSELFFFWGLRERVKRLVDKMNDYFNNNSGVRDKMAL